MALIVLALLVAVAFFMLGKGYFSGLQFFLFMMGALVTSFGVDNYFGFAEELEPRAQNFALLTMIVPGILLMLFGFMVKIKKTKN